MIMKKNYINPTTIIVTVKTQSLLVNYSTTEAASDAVSLGRDDDFDWDDEE